jgi:hypothetical protein
MGVGMVGLQSQGTLITSDGLVEFALSLQEHPQIAVIIRIVRRGGDGPANQVRRHIQPASLGGDQSRQMQRVGMIGLSGQDLPIDGLRLLKSPRLVMPKGDLHGLIDGHLRHCLNLTAGTYLALLA